MVPVTALVLGVVAAVAVLAGWRPAPPVRWPLPRAPHALTQRAALLRTGAIGVLDRIHPAGRRSRRDAQLPDVLDRVAAAVRSGQGIGPALTDAAPSASDPLRGELEAVAIALRHGGSVSEALERWSTRPDASDDVRLAAAALSLGAAAGGEVARAIDRISATLRERHEVRAEARALATQSRASAALLAVAPVGFAALVATIEPGVVGFLLTTPVGWLCLGGGLLLEGLGSVWMARITAGAR